MKTEIHILYLGYTISGDALYLKISSLDLNNGQSVEELKLTDKMAYNKKLFNGRPGAIFKVSMEGSKVFYNKKSLPVEYWKNKNDVIKWQTIYDAFELEKKKCREANKLLSDNAFKKSLDPIKEAYKNASYQHKQMILANIITYLNSR